MEKLKWTFWLTQQVNLQISMFPNNYIFPNILVTHWNNDSCVIMEEESHISLEVRPLYRDPGKDTTSTHKALGLVLWVCGRYVSTIAPARGRIYCTFDEWMDIKKISDAIGIFQDPAS